MQYRRAGRGIRSWESEFLHSKGDVTNLRRRKKE